MEPEFLSPIFVLISECFFHSLHLLHIKEKKILLNRVTVNTLGEETGAGQEEKRTGDMKMSKPSVGS